MVGSYGERIREVDRHGPGLKAVIELNPDAPAIARELDRERKSRGPETKTKRALPRDARRLYDDLKANMSTDNEYWWMRWKMLRDLRPDLAREVLELKDRTGRRVSA